MSRVKEIAEAEAARAEAEEPDAEEEESEGEAPPPAPEPEPPVEPQGPSEEQMKAVDREDKRHEKALAGIMQADFSYFARCGSCDGLGFYMPPPPEEVQFQPHPDTYICGTCQGMGDVASGARGRNQLLECPTCKGLGYLSKVTTGTAPVPAQPAAPATPSANGDPEVEALRARGYTVIEPFVPPTPGGPQ